MKKIIFIALILSFSIWFWNYANVEEAKVYTLMIKNQPYNLSLSGEKNKIVNTSILSGSPVELQESFQEPGLFYAQRRMGEDSWFLAGYPGLFVNEITIAPYFSFTSYRFLSSLQKIGNGSIYPECPLDTKYLIVLTVGPSGVPLAGCIF